MICDLETMRKLAETKRRKKIEKDAWAYSDTQKDADDDRATAYYKGYLAGVEESIKYQWRRADDEFPEDGDMVLIREYYRSPKTGKFVNHVRELLYYAEYGFTFERVLNANLPSYRITHWMPIPELPKTN